MNEFEKYILENYEENLVDIDNHGCSTGYGPIYSNDINNIFSKYQHDIDEIYTDYHEELGIEIQESLKKCENIQEVIQYFVWTTIEIIARKHVTKKEEKE